MQDFLIRQSFASVCGANVGKNNGNGPRTAPIHIQQRSTQPTRQTGLLLHINLSLALVYLPALPTDTITILNSSPYHRTDPLRPKSLRLSMKETYIRPTSPTTFSAIERVGAAPDGPHLKIFRAVVEQDIRLLSKGDDEAEAEAEEEEEDEEEDEEDGKEAKED